MKCNMQSVHAVIITDQTSPPLDVPSLLQSTISMGTGQTRLTSSDSASTKEGLSYAHIISTNTTDV